MQVPPLCSSPLARKSAGLVASVGMTTSSWQFNPLRASMWKPRVQAAANLFVKRQSIAKGEGQPAVLSFASIFTGFLFQFYRATKNNVPAFLRRSSAAEISLSLVQAFLFLFSAGFESRRVTDLSRRFSLTRNLLLVANRGPMSDSAIWRHSRIALLLESISFCSSE